MPIDFAQRNRENKFQKSIMEIHPNYLFEEEALRLEEEAEQISMATAPTFLGRFGMACYGEHYGRGRKLPPAHKAIAVRVMALFPEQRFNCAFIQRYWDQDEVKSHRDPMNNTGRTLILTYGPFEYYYFHCLGVRDVKPNTLLVLPCTMEFEGKLLQGPSHSCSAPVGRRYSLILNTIER